MFRRTKIPAMHFPRCHYNKQKGKRIKAKRSFDTMTEAFSYIHEKKLEDNYTAYKCDMCGKFHLGHKKHKK